MMQVKNIAPALRRVILAWLCAVTVQWLLLPRQVTDPNLALATAESSLFLIAALTVAFALLLQLAARHFSTQRLERWGVLAVFACLSVLSLSRAYRVGMLWACVVICAVLLVYALRGSDLSQDAPPCAQKAPKRYLVLTALIAAAAFAFLTAWTVCRVYALSCASYDFGIFAQMFHNMKTTGAPLTTLEREVQMSHFRVHMSPIYYLMLPFYCLFPSPQTLQILQAAVMVSAVIPLWMLAKRHGLSPLARTLVCAMLLAYPAFLGAVSYDLHENCFLTPLILWLLYAIDAKKPCLSAVFAVLLLLVKEDAAVYLAVIGIWLMARTLLRCEQRRKQFLLGAALTVGALVYFAAVSYFLSHSGDGVMSNRYGNYFSRSDDGLFAVVKTALVWPVKVLYECFDDAKLEYVLRTLLPVAAMPLFTRKYERFLLLIPYVLVNLMSDYPYQHSIFFQYSYGSCAFLFYLTVVNLADLRLVWLRMSAAALALCIGWSMAYAEVVPVAQANVDAYYNDRANCDRIRQTLSLVPEGAAVTATAFYTPQLSNREILYDVLHCTPEQLFSTEYVVLEKGRASEYVNYASTPGYDDGFYVLSHRLQMRGYRIVCELDDVLIIYQKQP